MRISSTTCLLLLTAWARLLGSSTPAFPTETLIRATPLLQIHTVLANPPLRPHGPRFDRCRHFKIVKLENASQAFSPSSMKKHYISRCLDSLKKKYKCYSSLKQVEVYLSLLQIWLAPNPIRQELAVGTTAGSPQMLRQWWAIIAEGTADWKNPLLLYVTCLVCLSHRVLSMKRCRFNSAFCPTKLCNDSGHSQPHSYSILQNWQIYSIQIPVWRHPPTPTCPPMNLSL